MWKCPECGRRFAQTNQMHSCGDFTVAAHFAGKPPAMRKLFDAYIVMVRKNGPVRLHPTKTRIGLISRMTFAALTPGKDRLRGHLVLSSRIDLPRFLKIEQFGPRCFVHYLQICSMDDLDDELSSLVAEAYRMGLQQR